DPLGGESSRLQHRSPPEDRGQWRSQLVRHGRQELILAAIGGFSVHARGPFARQQQLALALGVFAIRNVTHMRGENGLTWTADAGQRDLNRKFRTVRAQRRHFQTLTDNPRLARFYGPAECSTVPLS